MELILLVFFIAITFIFPSLGADLNSEDYPFSFRLGYNKAITFMNNDQVVIFDVSEFSKTQTFDTVTLTSPSQCTTYTEKGAIYSGGYYFLSCYVSSTEFKINVYDLDFIYVTTLPSSGTYYFNSGSSVRFFIIRSSQILVGAAWINDNKLALAKMDHNNQINFVDFSLSNIGKNLDCIFVNKYQRIICGFPYKMLIGDAQYACALNIFIDTDANAFEGAIYKIEECENHLAAKLSVPSDINEDSDIFYYYFVGLSNDAYISKCRATSSTAIKCNEPILIMKGCDYFQNTFDLANDKFIGYNIFSCVDSEFHTKIKIQLFKFDDGDNIIFYEDKTIYDYESIDVDGEASMINFVVLSEEGNFGYLTYRLHNSGKSFYSIFTKPECEPLEKGPVNQNTDLIIDFTDLISQKNYGVGEIKIVDKDPYMLFEQDSTNKKKFTFKSQGFTKETMQIIYKVKNNFFESVNCTVSIKITECYKNCKTCADKGQDFFHQLCTECKDGFISMDFPTGIESGTKNCCKKGGTESEEGCPKYLYEGTDGLGDSLMKMCDVKCIECSGPGDINCITCYNEKSLQNYSNVKNDIEDKKKEDSSSTTLEYYYFKNSNDKTCITETDCLNNFRGFLDPDEDDTCHECYELCLTCEMEGTKLSNNCKECILGYHKKVDDDNCFTGNQEGYYIDSVENIYKKCHKSCKTCQSSNLATDCLECQLSYYPKCSEDIENTPRQCYDQAPENYFYDDGCYKGCHSSCKTCDKTAEDTDDIKNCLSCPEGKVLYNRNCLSYCPDTHKQLSGATGKTCVLECPLYTIFDDRYAIADEEDANTFHYVCHNCKDTGEYRYMGTVYSDYQNKCVDKKPASTFQANDFYNILDDCYELCGDCSQRGTSTQMNCLNCRVPEEYCLSSGIGNCVKSGETLENYYETTNDNDECIFKQCYETCKTCDTGGDILKHKCTSCKDGYQFDPYTEGNCVIVCPYYWYIDSTTKEFTCTQEEKCPEDRPYFIEISKGCVEECSAAVHSSQRFFYRYKKTCITQCPENSMRDDLLYACHTLDDLNGIFVYGSNYIKQSIGAVNNLLLYNDDNTKLFHLFNTTELGLKTYKNNSFSVGTSIIDLSNCLNTLRHINGYSSSEVFYIGVLDIIRNDTSAPQFEYTVFNHLGKQLDINFCKTNELIIEKSLNQSNDLVLAKNILENYGYDIIDYQKNNKFFCDICAIFDYDKRDAYDVLLDDRYKYYYENQEYYFCEDTCKSQSTDVDLKSLRVKCVCSGKTNFTNYKKQSFQKYAKFSQNCRDEFLQYFKCGKNVFTKELFTKNVGNYFIFLFIVFQIGNIFLFYFHSKKPMMSHINDVLVKRAKKGYENDSESKSVSESASQSESQQDSRKSGTYTESGSQSGSKRGSGSQSGSKRESYSQSERQSVSERRSGTESQSGSENQSGTERKSGSKRQTERKSGSKRQSQNESEEGSQNENEEGSQNDEQSGNQEGSQEESDNENSNQTGSATGSKNTKSNKKSKNTKRSSKAGSKSSKANPPKSQDKKEKTKFAFVSIDNKEEEKNKPQETSENNNNFLNIELPNNENDLISNKEEDKEKKSINSNKKAPNPAWKKYAKRYLNDGHNYLDNSYREDSYNFDIPNDKKKKNNSDSDNESESEEESEKNSSSNNKNDSNINRTNNNDNISYNNNTPENNDINMVSKPKKNKNKNEELPAAMAPIKTDLEKFNDEIKKFEKFSFIELYWFILRKKHRIISLIIKKDIYDIFSIKLSLLILSYTIDFFVTTLFFFNFEIKKLFHLKQHLEPIYIVFMGLFCTLVSTALIKVVDFLMEYRTDFRRYEILQKYENDHSNYFSSLNGMIKGFKQKMIIYYIVMFIFSIFVWYMISAFIATYYNTKLIWGAMIGVNIGLSNIFPFIYYFLGVLFQYEGIHKQSYKMYKLGIVMIKI